MFFKIRGFGTNSFDSDELTIRYGFNTLPRVSGGVMEIIMGICGFGVNLSVVFLYLFIYFFSFFLF